MEDSVAADLFAEAVRRKIIPKLATENAVCESGDARGGTEGAGLRLQEVARGRVAFLTDGRVRGTGETVGVGAGLARASERVGEEARGTEGEAEALVEEETRRAELTD